MPVFSAPVGAAGDVGEPCRMALERFKRLPRQTGDEWQGGLIRVPSWIDRGPDGRPYRPWAGIWVSRKTGFVHLKMEAEPGAHDWTMALDALIEFGLEQQLAGYVRDDCRWLTDTSASVFSTRSGTAIWDSRSCPICPPRTECSKTWL